MRRNCLLHAYEVGNEYNCVNPISVTGNGALYLYGWDKERKEKLNAWLFFYGLQWISKLTVSKNSLSFVFKVKIEMRSSVS